jgi:hypothetical protein
MQSSFGETKRPMEKTNLNLCYLKKLVYSTKSDLNLLRHPCPASRELDIFWIFQELMVGNET